MREAGRAGIKPVIGCEFYFTDAIDDDMKAKKRLHLCVWAKSWAGVLSIMHQLSLANSQFYRRPLLSFEQALGFEDCIIGTACSFGLLSGPDYWARVQRLQAVYGDDLYLEVMPHKVILPDGDGSDLQELVNRRAVALHNELGVKLLATNDSHYTLEEDAKVHSTMMAIQYNQKVKDRESWPPVFFMRDMGQMFTAFMELGYLDHAHVSGAMQGTLSIAAGIDIQMPVFSANLPSIHEDEGRALMDFCLSGWKDKLDRKIGDQYATYRKRLIYELGVIKAAGFIPYFLMVRDIIQWARGQGIIVGPARGSAAGSLVCYLLDITRVDPLRFGLYFERFLNPERTDLPDIDVDFQDDRRDEVLAYIVERYGRDRVCGISTFNTMAVKGAFRDVCRSYGIDMLRINNLSTQLETTDDFDTVPELATFATRHPEIVEMSKRLDGVIRGVGQHACGVVISSQPLEQVAAIERRKGDAKVVCWDKRDCERFGLVKMDILGLTTLSIFAMALELVQKHHGLDITLEDIPLDDLETLAMLAEGDGNCVFQFEGDGMQALLKSLRVKSFNTLVACTALYRPGPLNAGLTNRYAKVERGEEYPRYAIPQLEPILASTNSVLVYQEQIMRVFSEVGGFTFAHADRMRKIISKKLGGEEFEKHRGDFIAGCEKNGVRPEDAGRLFNEMAGFAEYSFNKCVSGDTVIARCAAGPSPSNYTIREAFKIKNDVEYAKRTGRKSLRAKWIMQGGFGLGMSMGEDGRVRKNRIMDIQFAGVRDVYRVTLSDGSFIDATDNHSFPTPDGKKKLADIKAGESLYKRGDYEKTKRKYNYSGLRQEVKGKRYGARCGFPNGESNPGYTDGGFSTFKRFKDAAGDTCQVCGSVGKIECHHKDGGRDNHDHSNLQALCPSCHKKAHYITGRVKRGEKGYPVEVVEIASIECIGETDTYDVTMEAPNHNFVIDNGIITCNSHAVAYTMISFWSAYLKQHYPAIFIASYLSCVKSDDALVRGIAEARKMGIAVELPNINLSTTRYEYDPVDGGIIAPLSIVKGVGDKAVVEILKAREAGVFLSVDDFLERVYERVVNKRVIEALKLAGAFSTLGIKEHDREARERNEAELMPVFESLPTLSLNRSKPIDHDQLLAIHGEIEGHCEREGLKSLSPVMGRAPVLMVVNSQMKGEASLGTNKSTCVIFTDLNMAGIDKRSITYTSVIKTVQKDPRKVPSAERILGESWLRAEIRAVAPKLIYCCNAEAVPLFSPGDKMSKLYGRLKFNREFDCYVLFGPSPQFASFKPEQAGDQYLDCMTKIKTIFNTSARET